MNKKSYKKPELKADYPFTRRGYEGARDALINLKADYQDEWHALHDKLFTIKIGYELEVHRKRLNEIQSQITKLSEHLARIRKEMTNKGEEEFLL